mmetsp:Transcript_36692/g.72617  ORF Transcript_36692/g.72617 Transcript_36692/m.72617 type:complete len:342 (-) Transcript_36692:117-1142(-)
MAESAEKGKLLVLLLSNGMSPADFTAAVEGLKNQSKSIGTHKRRELFWQAYEKLGSKAASLEGTPQCFLSFSAAMDDEGKPEEGSAEVTELTKRQRGLLGSVDLLGHKIKAAEDPKAKSWLMAWSEDEAQEAWDDLMGAEPCIYLTSDGVFVATRYKRVLCKALSGLPKTLKDVEEIVGDLAPEKPLRSVSFVGNDPPVVNGYNVFLVGQIDKALGPALPSTIGHVQSTSTSEIYDYFLQRRNGHVIGEAGKLIAQMVADVGKGLVPVIGAGSTRDASKAYKNALMKRVYVHESMGKFIDRVRSDGQVELWVIQGDVEDTEFGKYGKLVWELFYRADLEAF